MTQRYPLGVTIWLFDVFSTFVTARPFFSADRRDDIASVAIFKCFLHLHIGQIKQKLQGLLE